MADYNIIANISEKLISLLRDQLSPGFIDSREQISLCSPANNNGVSLGVFLYDVKESEEISRSNMLQTGIDTVRFPPIILNLYYMITPYGTGDPQYQMITEHNLLGRVIQYFHDYSIIPIESLITEGMSGVDLHIELLRLSTDERSKIWSFRDAPYHPSLFYKVSPVTIDSERRNRISRVRQVEINVKDEL